MKHSYATPLLVDVQETHSTLVVRAMETLESSFPILAFVGSIALASAYRACHGRSKISDVVISELWVYPIKSCKGIRMSSVNVLARGFELDRAFMVVDASGKFVTQRSFPSMALAVVSLQDSADAGRIMQVNAPGMETLTIPLSPSPSMGEIDVTVWGDTCKATIVEDKWFSTYLNTPGLRLVRMKDDFVRKTDSKYAPEGQTGFADGFPFLLAAEESLQLVNSKLAEPITQARFRPNIIVRGGRAFEEDQWEKIRIHDVKYGSNRTLGTVEMSVVKPCARCTIPNVDPEKGVAHPQREPSRSMLGFRSGEAIGFSNAKWQKQIFYGQNLDHAGQSGLALQEGARVEVLRANAPFFGPVKKEGDEE